jgi:hypothetical protein
MWHASALADGGLIGRHVADAGLAGVPRCPITPASGFVSRGSGTVPDRVPAASGCTPWPRALPQRMLRVNGILLGATEVDGDERPGECVQAVRLRRSGHRPAVRKAVPAPGGRRSRQLVHRPGAASWPRWSALPDPPGRLPVSGGRLSSAGQAARPAAGRSGRRGADDRGLAGPGQPSKQRANMVADDLRAAAPASVEVLCPSGSGFAAVAHLGEIEAGMKCGALRGQRRRPGGCSRRGAA